MSYIKNSEFYACFKGTEILKQVKHQMIDYGCYTTSRYPCQSPMSNVTCMQAYTGIRLGTSIAAGSYLHKGQKRRLIFVRTAWSVETPPQTVLQARDSLPPSWPCQSPPRLISYCQEGSAPQWISFPFIFKWLFWYEHCWICTGKNKIEAQRVCG